ncbi:50S ribosomal protein L18 [Mesomycoplasma molare]|uniref:Large ribosomal subunit protein uL18 n=1 Tax=Mesomycoplasma molare TaxID=171288 RepID=A0ABY5TUR7_9BACT|nr:50S ribosomal protein L18 [Mesomycoplasma molare]UWD34305.1 50S ribosomal protein L18 [Mesomycoplasma molare]
MAKMSRNKARIQKHYRIKSKLTLGTANKPRLSVFKSLTNFYAQLIDDTKGVTLASVSTLKHKEYSGNIKLAESLGTLMGKKIKELKIESIVFDRSGYIYHGRVKAFAEAVRKEGVKF